MAARVFCKAGAKITRPISTLRFLGVIAMSEKVPRTLPEALSLMAKK